MTNLNGNNLARQTFVDDLNKKVINRVTYDNSDQMRVNAFERSERGKSYKGNLVHVGRFHLGDIERLHAMGYKLLSPDPEEVKRALLYVQANEPAMLTVEGKPFSKKRLMWF